MSDTFSKVEVITGVARRHRSSVAGVIEPTLQAAEVPPSLINYLQRNTRLGDNP